MTLAFAFAFGAGFACGAIVLPIVWLGLGFALLKVLDAL